MKLTGVVVYVVTGFYDHRYIVEVFETEAAADGFDEEHHYQLTIFRRVINAEAAMCDGEEE